MDAERGVFSQWKAVILRREPLFVEGVSCFVDAAPGHMTEISFIDAGGDADVIAIEAGGKRMFGEVLATGFEIEPQPADQVQAKIPLLLLGIVAVEERIIYG